MRKDNGTSSEMGSGKGARSGNSPFLFPAVLVTKKKGVLPPVIDLPLLNQYIKKQPFKMDSQVSMTIYTSQ